MNPHAAQKISLRAMVLGLLQNRQLIAQLINREVVGRYKGSVMGLLWSFLNPIFMLSIYTFVFSYVFKSRWSGADVSHGEFAIVAFAGLIVHGVFAEVLGRAPRLIMENANFVKKVVFPLEVLVPVVAGSALFHALISVLVLLAAQLVTGGAIPWTVFLLPLVFLPLILLSIGAGWLFASLGVFLRDLGQLTGVLISVLMYLSPVFFPISALPERVRPLFFLNPLTFIIEQARAVLIWGSAPSWPGLAIYIVASAMFAWFGFAWFQKTRKGFADVI